FARPVPIVGAAAVSAHGLEWRGLSRSVRHGCCAPLASNELATTHPGTLSFELQALAEATSLAEKRARPLMSRSAVLAAMATRAVLGDAGWSEALEDVGFYLGVGASGGSLDQLTSMLAASVEDHALSLTRFGDQGLAACNPLFAFQLMNNFSLCHSAIFHGTQGPNAAFFSRGTGTVVALLEAAEAILSEDCARALAGGADSSVHAVTWAELVREGWAERGLVPGEGAALLALARPTTTEKTHGFLDYAAVAACRTRPPLQALAAVQPELDCASIDAVVLAPWGPPARAVLRAFADAALPGRLVVDTERALGESLAATPALACTVALDLLSAEGLARVLILSHGLDGDLGVVTIRSGGP
ncbi:MAG TPA: beta-ketoacyl synthase N-terminal-like domain-containing protein, partial [Polyangiaceae bacterium]|nr:beta-ketoacyl synthase N-terminal-like domain-containing protein [Polyangiaceae bacterium]